MLNIIGIVIVVLIVFSLLSSTQQKGSGAKRNGDLFPKERQEPDEPIDVDARIVPDDESAEPEEKAEATREPEVKSEPASEPRSDAEVGQKVRQEPEQEPGHADIGAEALTPEILAARFFAKPFSGEADKKLFEALKGREAEWIGTLKNAYTFSSDFIFGMKKGVRATIELCEIADSYGFKRKVVCVAAFLPEFEFELKEKTGQRITFRGTLHSVEAISKEIRLDHAELM